MEFINLTNKPLKFAGSKEGLLKMIVLPDYCPGKGILPVGLVAVYDRGNHSISSEYLGPDVGCGMTLAKFKQPIENLEYVNYKIASALDGVNTELGSLGSGNHFIDIYNVKAVDKNLGLKEGEYLVLVHSGSRLKGQEVYEKGNYGEDYIRDYYNLIKFGKENRKRLLVLVEKNSENKLGVILDRAHNTMELFPDRVIYRKGAVRLKPNEIGVIPSSMVGKAILIKGKDNLRELEFSMCHGTGRKLSRSEAKKQEYNFNELRKKIHIPNIIPNWQITTETPDCYNTIDDILPGIEKYIEIVGILEPKAYSS